MGVLALPAHARRRHWLLQLLRLHAVRTTSLLSIAKGRVAMRKATATLKGF